MMCNNRKLRLSLVRHVTKQFLSLNLTLPHPLQGTVPPEGFFASSLSGRVETLSVCEKNQLHVKVSEATVWLNTGTTWDGIS